MGKFIIGIEEKYPKEILQGRLTVEGNVIAVLYNDPLLVDDCGLSSSDFVTSDGKFYFSLAKRLRKAGYVVFDEVTILSSINEEILSAFNERGGYETIRNIADIVDTKNADVYVDNLFRENVIMRLYDDGFNLTKEIEWHNKPAKPIDIFRKMDCESVIDWYDAELSTFKTGTTGMVTEEEMLDFSDEFIDSCEEGMENGVPFDCAGTDINGEDINCFPFLSRQINGLNEGATHMIGGYSSSGKSTWWLTIIMALIYRGRKVLLITNEESIKKFKIKLMVWILGKRNRYFKLTKKKLTSGIITDEDKAQIKSVQKFWRTEHSNSLKLISINDANMSVVKKKIREAVLQDGVDTVLYDTFKIQAMDINGARQDLALVRDSRELDRLAKKYKLIMLASIQLAEFTKGQLFLNASVLSNSKQIKEQLESLFLMRTVYDEELDPKSKYYCKPFRLKKVEDKWIEEPYEADRSAVWRMLFIEKTRNGTNSSDTGCCYLIRFSGDHAILREVAQCRPSHGRID